MVTVKEHDNLSLHPDHLLDLENSGLSDGTIREAGIYTVPPKDINKRLGPSFPHPSKINSLLAFPYPGTDGFERYKLFPSIEDRKYHQKEGTGNHLYIPPKAQAILKDPSIPLHFTEGEKKSLKATQEGLFCIGLGGLWNWSDGTEEKNLIPDFDLIEWKGRTVYLIPDNDWEQPDRRGEKKNLRQAVYEFAYRLIDRGARVFVIELPQGPDKGLDDFLCRHSINEFHSLPKRAIRKLTIEEMIQEASLENLKEILKRLSDLPEAERAVHINSLSKRLRIAKRAIQKNIQSLSRKKKETLDINLLLESGENPGSEFSAQNFSEGVLSFGVIINGQRLLVRSDGEFITEVEEEIDGKTQRFLEWSFIPANGSNDGFFRFTRSTLTAEAIKRFRAGEDVDGKDLLNRIRTLFADHVILSDNRIPILLGVWTLGTYFFKMFRYYGYVWVNSPVKRCAKSRVLNILSPLCFNATSRLVDPSSSFLFRETDRNDGTLVIDEVEGLGGADKDQKSEIIGLFNAGFERDGKAPRVEKKDGQFVPTFFNVYSPKALAGIKSIVDTIEDRSFKILMLRKKKSEIVKRLNLRALDSHIKKIREDCFIWALRYASDVSEVYDKTTEVPGTENLDDRLKDILEPLLSIASVIDAQADETQTVKTLIALACEMGNHREYSESLSGTILAVVNLMKGLLDGAQDRFISSEDMFNLFKGDEDLKWVKSKNGVASFLGKLGLRVESSPRWIGGKAVRGYSVTGKWLQDLASRYA